MAHSFSQIPMDPGFSTKDHRNSIPKQWQPRHVTSVLPAMPVKL